jgi:hypothetical protein
MNIKDRVILDGSMNFPRFMVGRGTMDTTKRIIQDLGATPLIEMTEKKDLTISSSSASDTADGTGMRMVKVYGLDENWNKVEEIVTLNGQTAVALTEVKLHPYVIVGMTAGSGLTNAGKIYVGYGEVTSGLPANIVLALDSTGSNQSRAAFMPVPNNYEAIIGNIGYTSTGAGTFHGEFKYLGGVWLIGFSLDTGTYNQNGEIRDIMTPKLPPKTLIRLTAKAATGTILFGGYANLLFIKKGGNLL